MENPSYLFNFSLVFIYWASNLQCFYILKDKCITIETLIIYTLILVITFKSIVEQFR